MTQALLERGPTTDAATDAAALIDYLRERDVACPLCRYNLRGLQTSRCPECGRELRLGVWLAEPRLAAWVVGLVASMLPAGVGALLVLTVIVSGWPYSWSSSEAWFINLCLLAFVAFIPVALVMLLFRRPFMRLTVGKQWGVAALLVLAGAGTFVAYILAAPM